jgi:hypothetical protein
MKQRKHHTLSDPYTEDKSNLFICKSKKIEGYIWGQKSEVGMDGISSTQRINHYVKNK